MLTQLLLQILDWVFGFFTLALLARVLMQWARVPFRNPLGQFVIAVTDWAVIPARRLIPAAAGIDLPSVLLAVLAQVLLQLLLQAFLPTGLYVALMLALFAVLRLTLYLISGVVIVSALMSWINPHAPLAPLFHLLTRPFLAPLQRVIPPVGGIDLTPMLLLLILQVLLSVLAAWQVQMMPLSLMLQ